MASHSSGESVTSDDSSGSPSLPIRDTKPKRSGPSEFVFIDYKGDRRQNDAGFTAQKSLMRAHVMRDYHRRQKQIKYESLRAALEKIPRDAPLMIKPKAKTTTSTSDVQKHECCKGI